MSGCPNAERAPDGFHIVSWTSDAPDKVRRHPWNPGAPRRGREIVKRMRGVRYTVLKNPGKLTDERSEASGNLGTRTPRAGPTVHDGSGNPPGRCRKRPADRPGPNWTAGCSGRPTAASPRSSNSPEIAVIPDILRTPNWAVQTPCSRRPTTGSRSPSAGLRLPPREQSHRPRHAPRRTRHTPTTTKNPTHEKQQKSLFCAIP